VCLVAYLDATFWTSLLDRSRRYGQSAPVCDAGAGAQESAEDAARAGRDAHGPAGTRAGRCAGAGAPRPQVSGALEHAPG
jgi:hypothetical protein